MTGNTSSWENPVTWTEPGIISQPFCHHCPDELSCDGINKGGLTSVENRRYPWEEPCVKGHALCSVDRYVVP